MLLRTVGILGRTNVSTRGSWKKTYFEVDLNGIPRTKRGWRARSEFGGEPNIRLPSIGPNFGTVATYVNYRLFLLIS